MAVSNRRKSRELALKIIYQRSKIKENPSGEKFLYQRAKLHAKHQEFCQELVQKTWQNKAEIDGIIQKNLSNWKQSRITDSLSNLLRIGSCELLYFQETQGEVTINEALEICKAYVDEKLVKMCNGVLNSVWRGVQSSSDSQSR